MLSEPLSPTGVPIYPDDTLEDLQRNGFRMLQKKHGFRFGMDSVLLSAFAASFCSPKAKTIRIADLGAGCGAVSLLLAARLPNASFAGLELDPQSCETFGRNRSLNNLSGRLKVVQGDIRQLSAAAAAYEELPPNVFDLVVSNPPYRRPGQTCRRPKKQGEEGTASWQQALEETDMSLSDLFLAASRLLKTKGRLILVHRVFRLPDIIVTLRQNGLEPKTLRLIQSLPNRAPTTFLLSAVKQGKPGGFIVEPPLLVCSRPGVLSEEAAAWYGLEPPLPHADLFRGLYREFPGKAPPDKEKEAIGNAGNYFGAGSKI